MDDKSVKEKVTNAGQALLGFAMLLAVLLAIGKCNSYLEPKPMTPEERKHLTKKLVLDLEKAHIDEVLMSIYFKDISPEELPTYYQEKWKAFQDGTMPEEDSKRLLKKIEKSEYDQGKADIAQ